MAVCGWDLPLYWEDHFVLQWQSRIALISEVSIHFSSLSPSIILCLWGQQCKDTIWAPWPVCSAEVEGGLLSRVSVLVPEWRFLCYESFWLLVAPLVFLPFLILILWPWWLHELPNAVFCLYCVVLFCLCVCVWLFHLEHFSFVSPPFLWPSV